ncbi:MAG: acetolactate synthase large subunit [Pseudonocardiales bacterium]|nr:acetolactate synthase large subunit [Pseudonocardiales bacterium]
MKAYQAFAAVLADHGVSAVFGVIGDGNMHWISAYNRLPGTLWCPAWHEAGALGMADGYAAALGDVGVATVTMGPGLAQSLAALTAAVRTRRSVLLITAETSEHPPGQAQSAEQAAWVQACGATYIRVDSAADLADAVARSLAIARGGTPCVLSVVINVFGAELEQIPQAAPQITPAVPRDVSNLDAAVQLLTGARAPLVVVGRGATGCIAEVLELGRSLGAAFLTTVGAKGVLGGEPFRLELTGWMATPLAREIAAEADVVLIVGAALDLYNTEGGAAFGTASIVRIDNRAPAQLWDPAPERVVHLTGDAAYLVQALAKQLPEPYVGLRTQTTLDRLAVEGRRQEALTTAPQPDGPNPWAVVSVFNELLPEDAYFVVGIGHFWYFLAPYLRTNDQRRFQFGCGFALIGQALPLAVGAAVAEPGGLVVALEGDGSMAMNLQELQSAVRFGRDLLVLVMNNRGYGSEYHKLVLGNLDTREGTFEDAIDLVAVAQALGVTARRAEDLDSLRDGLNELVGMSGVRLLDVSIAITPMSEVYRRQHA